MFIDAIPLLSANFERLQFDQLNDKLYKATGWQVLVVPESIPEVSLFILLMRRKFPVVNCIRRLDELDCVAESDMFHDLFDRVPIVVQSFFQKSPASLYCNRNKSARSWKA